MSSFSTTIPPTPASDTNLVRLDRSLGLVQVTASGVGIIVGAGIYVLIGTATSLAGPRVWLGFLAAALVSVLTAMSYGELASMFPKAGAEFEYTRHAFPPWLAFLVGWVMFVGLMVAAGAVALGFGLYLGQFVPVSPRLGALVLLVGVGAVAWGGIRRSARLTVVLSMVQVGGLVAVIAIGVPHFGQVDLLADGGTGVTGVLGAAALAFFAFIGFDEVITLSEETRNPRRIIPLGLFLALGISTILYLGVAVAAVSVLGPDALGASPRPLADVLTHALGARGGDALAVVAMLATMNTTLLCLTAASRLQYGMARSGALPAALARTGTRTAAPHRAIAVAVLVAGGFVLVGDVKLVASVTDVAVFLVFLAVNATVIILRFRRPEQERPFRTPGRVGKVPVVPVLAVVSVLVMLPSIDWRALLLASAATAVGLSAHGFLGRRSRPAVTPYSLPR